MDTQPNRISANRIMFVCIVLIFIFTRSYIPLYTITQNEYYAHAFANSQDVLLQNDWFVQTQLKHVIFSRMVEGLYRLDIVETGTYAIQVALEAIFYISAFYIFRKMFESLRWRRERFGQLDINTLSFVSTLVLMLVHNSFILVAIANQLNEFIPDAHLLWREFSNFSGLAVQVMNGGYLQPSEFGILFFPAVALALHSRWRLATILLGIVVNFHFSYSIHCGVFILVFVGILLYQRKWRHAFEVCLIFGVIVLPITIYAVSFLGDPLADYAAMIFAVEMFPFHSLPKVFLLRPQQMNILKMLMIFAAILICWRFQFYRLRAILVSGFILVSVSLAYVYFTSDYSVAILFPWRASVFLVPLAAVVIIAWVVWIITLLLRENLLTQPSFGFVLGLLIVAIFLAEGFMFMRWTVIGVDNSGAGDEVGGQIFAGITDATGPDDIILIPTEQVGVLPPRFWAGARLALGRAIYVDSFSFPMLGKDVAEFWDRLQFVESFYQQPLDVQFELCREANVDYFVSYQTDVEFEDKQVLTVDPVYLYPCES